jgi:murein DD-endopeptidase MepM/ murein hydrolase activator NlpD
MATPASVPQSALTKAMGMVGRAAAGAAMGLGRRKASRLAMKNLRLLLAVLLTGTALTAALFVVPILLVVLTLGAGLSATLPVTGVGITGVPGPPLAPGMLACPVPGSVVSQPFGPSSLSGEPALFGYPHFHAGIDLAAPSGTPVLAAEGGTVSAATAQLNSLGLLTGYGNYVDVIAPGGRLERYGHLQTWLVSTGQGVQRYQPIGLLDSTGYSTGPHTHFEVRVNGTPVDPAPSMTRC